MANQDSENLTADYLASIRNTDLYRETFDDAYQDPESVLTSVGNVRGMLGDNIELFDVVSERMPARSPDQKSDFNQIQNYSKSAQQLRQFIGLNRPVQRRPSSGSLNYDRVVRQLAMSEALESHEQQGVRFDDGTMGINRKAPIPGNESRSYRGYRDKGRGQSYSGFPKSTRSMGQTVDPLQGTGEQKNTTDETLMKNMRKK